MNVTPVINECIRLVDEQLASSQREMGDVRSILEDAVVRLIRDRSSATALQFQDISDQLLAHASERLESVRSEMERTRAGLEARTEAPAGVAHAMYGNLLTLAKKRAKPVHAADLEPGSIELF